MSRPTNIKIVTLHESSPHLNSVIELGDQHRKIFSHWAKCIYLKHARLGTILIALTQDDDLLGYLLYRTSSRKNQVTLHQLCIYPQCRGMGIAKSLIEKLKKITTQYNGIRIKCRRDYGLEKMWSSFGFSPLYEENARTKGKVNTIWWYAHKRPLFSWLSENQYNTSIKLILDIDLFLLLDRKVNSEDCDQVISICHDDWDITVEVHITDEILSVINNNFQDSKEREKYRKIATQFIQCMPLGNEISDKIAAFISFFEFHQVILKDLQLKHFSRAVLLPEIQYFITQNSDLLELRDNIYEEFSIFVKKPDELILELSTDTVQDSYQPKKLSGIQKITQTSVKKHIKNIENKFLKTEDLIDKSIINYINQFINDFMDWQEICDENGNSLILFFCDWKNKNCLTIPLIRLDNSPYSTIIFNHLLFKIVVEARKNGKKYIELSKKYLQESVINILRSESSWIQTDSSWLRVIIDEIGTSSELSKKLQDQNKLSNLIPIQYSQLIDVLDNAAELTKQNTLEIENSFFPVKVIDSCLLNFIIPIKPEWAKHLFDENLANENLFGRGELALNTEAVYYKSTQSPKRMKPGNSGRILWYVSNDKDHGYSDLCSVRACSQLVEIKTDKPGNLYQSFKNLGVYGYEDLLKVAGNNPDREIMALRFRNTELFEDPVSLRKVQEILQKNVTMQSSLEILNTNFKIIYQEGK
ncbi:GNAT family N-acetyltransferase [Spirulina major]|uniref:GNAT family N-acetyltransferase n=1 Tax=Spirulina major TaxID=270636 RepID=UPI000934DB79|nr:GNAT family N-acetyltransferase [Spirulina major]